MNRFLPAARTVIERCRQLAQFTEEPGFTTRTFLSEPMRPVHAHLREWMGQAGMSVTMDAAGNIRGCRADARGSAKRLYIGSHIDTVPRAGAFDGVLGVLLAVALVELIKDRHLAFDIEAVAFSEEEGVRFGVPFIGSRALIGDAGDDLLDCRDSHGVTVRDAIRGFGLDPSRMAEAQVPRDGALAYLEFHIEQGPLLDELNLPLGVVEAIVGQSRLNVAFEGSASHAGTTPMHLRRDALAGAAEWIGAVEREARAISGLVATVGRLEAQPGAANVIAGLASATLDVRHASDSIRRQSVDRFLKCAEQIATRRGLRVATELRLDQASVPLDPALVQMMERAVGRSGFPVHRMSSGAGHDAVIMASHMPSAMLFLRSPGGISHHPGETVVPEDVAAALSAGDSLLKELETTIV